MDTLKSVEVKTEEKLAIGLGLRTKQFLLASLALMRPKQWVKNSFVFAGLIFSQNILEPQLFLLTFWAFISFCLLSSSVYIINDLSDIEEDKLHPRKKNRPLPAGRITSTQAISLLTVLLAASLLLAWNLGNLFFAVAVIYFLLIVGYTFLFKHIVLLDIFTISAGFILRVVAGTVVISVIISPWLLICTLLLSLFLALIKRRAEIVSLENGGVDHRKVLQDYSIKFVDQLISIITAATITAYSVYTFTASKTEFLMLSIPFVIYGLFRYLYLVHEQDMGCSPEEVLFKDKPLLINISIWVVLSAVILYLEKWSLL